MTPNALPLASAAFANFQNLVDRWFDNGLRMPGRPIDYDARNGRSSAQAKVQSQLALASPARLSADFADLLPGYAIRDGLDLDQCTDRGTV